MSNLLEILIIKIKLPRLADVERNRWKKSWCQQIKENPARV